MPDPKRVYSDDEVRAILSRAVDRQRASAPEGLSHDDLLAVARDAGISPEALEAAAAEITTKRAVTDDEIAIRKENASGFRAHVFTYVVVMAFLAFVNIMFGPYPWVLWPAFGWGLGLAFHAFAAKFPSEAQIARQVERRARRRRRAEERERRRLARNDLKEGARELGHAVERGVAVLLTETARRLHEEIGPEPEARAKRVRVEEGEREGKGEGQDEQERGSEEEARKRR